MDEPNGGDLMALQLPEGTSNEDSRQPSTRDQKAGKEKSNRKKELTAPLSMVYFYKYIVEENKSFVPMITLFYLLNGSITTGYYFLVQSFGQTGWQVGVGLTIVVVLLNYVAACGTLETVARVESLMKAKEDYSGMIVLKTKKFGQTRLVERNNSRHQKGVRPMLDDRRIEYAEMLHHLFPKNIVGTLSVSLIYQMFQTSAIYWYLGITNFEAATQLVFMLKLETYHSRQLGFFTLDLNNAFASAGVFLAVFGLSLLRQKSFMGVQGIIVPVKLFLVGCLLVVLVAELFELQSHDLTAQTSSLTSQPRPFGNRVFFDWNSMYLPLSWLYSSLNINNLLPGAVCLLQNKNYTSKSVLKLYHTIFGLLTVAGGLLYVFNFGDAKVILYKRYSYFDSGFHEISPLWAYLGSRILAYSPIYFVIVAMPVFINNSTENLRQLCTSTPFSNHFQTVVFRFLNCLAIYLVSLVLQTLSPGIYLSVSGLLFCVACVIFPLAMHLRAIKLVPEIPISGGGIATFKAVVWASLALSVFIFGVMTVLFFKASKQANSQSS